MVTTEFYVWRERYGQDPCELFCKRIVVSDSAESVRTDLSFVFQEWLGLLQDLLNKDPATKCFVVAAIQCAVMQHLWHYEVIE